MRLARSMLVLLVVSGLLAAGGAANPSNGRADDGRLDPELLKKVKRATVYLRVTLPDGQVVQGSGFFGSYAGLVMTNAHVLGMLRPESQKPKKVEVVIN